jgi:preflagellin peptidase FlaK
MDWLVIARLVVALGVLGYASYTDWRTREASDLNWLAIGIVGYVLLATDIAMSGAPPVYFIFLVPVGVLFFDMFWDRKGVFEDGIHVVPMALYALAAISLAVLLVLYGNDPYLWRLLTIPLLFVFFFLLYQFDVIKGGADAKALIALALLFPSYPVLGQFPLIHLPTDLAQYVFPFALLVLFDAALLSLVVPIILFFYNAGKHDLRFPAMLFGYRVDVASVRQKFVWPMERLDGERIRLILFPRRDEAENAAILDELERAGVKRIWATPKIPFLIPIAAAVAFSFIVGNILFLLIH